MAKIKQLKSVTPDPPLEQYRVSRRIHGLVLSPDSVPIQIGDFRVGLGSHFFGAAKGVPIFDQTFREDDLTQSFIECTVKARDVDSAVEIADRWFYRFELLFRVFIGIRTTNIEVGVLNYVGPQRRDRFVLSDSGRPVGMGLSWKGAMQPFVLGDSRFPFPNASIVRLFQLVSRDNNDFEKHIVRCAEWTGQALAEPNAASAFVKAAIALEVMFSTNEKGIISPSIMAQIAESCAFLLGNDETSPLKIESEVKRLYGIRSSVVHSGKDTVNEDDLKLLINICRNIVLELLSNQEFSGVKTMTNLTDYLKRKRYSIQEDGNPQNIVRTHTEA